MKSVAAAVALLALSVGSAQAFTYQSTSQLNADVKSNLADPDDQLANGSNKSKSGFSVHFSGGPTDSTGLGVQSRFLPTRNSAFNSPFQSQNNYDPFSPHN
jgi:hypothetical protein